MTTNRDRLVAQAARLQQTIDTVSRWLADAPYSLRGTVQPRKALELRAALEAEKGVIAKLMEEVKR